MNYSEKLTQFEKVRKDIEKNIEKTGINSDMYLKVSDADLRAHPVIVEPCDVVTNKPLVRPRTLLGWRKARFYYGCCECRYSFHRVTCYLRDHIFLFQCKNNIYVWAEDYDLIPIDAKICDRKTTKEVLKDVAEHLHAEELRKFSDGFTGNMVEAASIQIDAKSFDGNGFYIGSKCLVRKDRCLEHYSSTDLVPEDSQIEQNDHVMPFHGG